MVAKHSISKKSLIFINSENESLSSSIFLNLWNNLKQLFRCNYLKFEDSKQNLRLVALILYLFERYKKKTCKLFYSVVVVAVIIYGNAIDLRVKDLAPFLRSNG